MKNYINCTKRNWQNITMQAAGKNDGNKDINNIIKGGGCNNKFDSK